MSEFRPLDWRKLPEADAAIVRELEAADVAVLVRRTPGSRYAWDVRVEGPRIFSEEVTAPSRRDGLRSFHGRFRDGRYPFDAGASP